jgi:hypothetical protein
VHCKNQSKSKLVLAISGTRRTIEEAKQNKEKLATATGDLAPSEGGLSWPYRQKQ